MIRIFVTDEIRKKLTTVKLAEPDHSAGRKELFYWIMCSPMDIVIYENHQ